LQQEAGIWQIRRQPGIRSHVLGDGMSPPSRKLGGITNRDSPQSGGFQRFDQ